jgi:hypothetical protein
MLARALETGGVALCRAMGQDWGVGSEGKGMFWGFRLA